MPGNFDHRIEGGLARGEVEDVNRLVWNRRRPRCQPVQPSQPSRIHTVPDGMRSVTWAYA